ncbi:hypothetical protein [Arenimonas composti]|uniref:Uncharacterized protein n=1 Tax=Arenimonas composti TR7-09 = DSM 18010 TaxID=1121013 RepID=A0A091BIQ0_9GAMM|nr:hypothetical protein [Arenimonas composti]KFN50664.1 hypothetical protein P873_05750 [Arenimonas composti TR7-09 = DSM 18010]
MAGDDEDRGFKGLGKLKSGEAPPPTPSSPGPPPLRPRHVTPPPAPGGPPGGRPPPPKTGMSGCLKAALILLGLLIALVLGLVVLGWLFAPSAEERAAYAEERARRAAESLAAERAESERVDACRASVGARPGSGDELSRRVGFGQHTVRVTAGSEDAVVKLRQDGRTAIAFYVRAGETGTIEDLPDGTYRVMFATGSEFSTGCGEFLRGMQVSADPEPATFLPTVEAGQTYYQELEYRLTRQAGGNFMPDSAEAADFRDLE